MTDKILDTLKNFLDLTADVSNFDSQLLLLLNETLSPLKHLGVISNSSSFEITKDSQWTDLITIEDFKSSVKIYMFISVRLIFDPPTNAQYKAILESKLNRLEGQFSLYEEAPPITEEPPVEE